MRLESCYNQASCVGSESMFVDKVGTYDEAGIMLQSGFVRGVRINVCRQGRNIWWGWNGNRKKGIFKNSHGKKLDFLIFKTQIFCHWTWNLTDFKQNWGLTLTDQKRNLVVCVCLLCMIKIWNETAQGSGLLQTKSSVMICGYWIKGWIVLNCVCQQVL